MSYLIAPSLLSANLMRLGEEMEAILQAGAHMIHLDVMDNHYVPNLTFGPGLCEALKKSYPTLPIDVHIMASPVDDLILSFAKAGATRISIHPEATLHLDRSLQSIRENGCKAGLVLNPATGLDMLPWCIHRLDFILVMTVNPGFGGQKLIPETLEKIAAIHQLYPHLPICVDGGVHVDNIKTLALKGATEFVAGSAIFHSKDYAKTITAMLQQLNQTCAS
jgi:ribulose-phosphate 3-epimerase